MKIQLLQLSAFDAIEVTGTDALQEGGNRQALRPQARGEPGRTELVQQLERTPAPAEAGAQSLVDGRDVFCNLRRHLEGIRKRCSEHPPAESTTAIRMLENGPRPTPFTFTSAF